MPCDPLTFRDVTPELYARLAQKAEDEGITIGGVYGQVEAKGCKFSWAYQESTLTLMIVCEKTPWYASCGKVNVLLAKLMKDARCEVEAINQA